MGDLGGGVVDLVLGLSCGGVFDCDGSTTVISKIFFFTPLILSRELSLDPRLDRLEVDEADIVRGKM